MSQFETLFKSVLVISSFFFLAGCGQGNVNSDGLNIILAPSNSYMVPGTTSNCVDRQNYKGEKESPTSTTLPALQSSVTALWASFPHFGLTWTKNQTLFVVDIKVSITSTQLSGNYSADITGNELGALLGSQTNSFAGKNTMFNSTDLEAPNGSGAVGTIYSDDPARDCLASGLNFMTGGACTYHKQIASSSATACGLAVGGIKVPATATNQFSVPFVIKLVGYSVDGQNNTTPVQTQTTGTVTYLGIQ